MRIFALYQKGQTMDFVTQILHLLSEEYVCFQDDMIGWDGAHHVIQGLYIDENRVPALMQLAARGGFDDPSDYLNHFVGFLGLTEQDEDLIVPRERIDKALHPLLREGDLTGLMLANLCACNKALMVDSPEENKYTVAYDTRLAKGIPCFFDLVAHLIWRLRQPLRSLRSCSFDISFISARNFDLDQMVDGEVSFVAGAQEYPGAMTVTDAPEIDFS